MYKIEYKKQEIREKYMYLFKYFLELICVHDLKGTFLNVNDIRLSTLGYIREEILNISFKDFVDKEQLLLYLGKL